MDWLVVLIDLDGRRGFGPAIWDDCVVELSAGLASSSVDAVRGGRRKTATRVRSGRVQKKNNWAADRRDYFAWSQAEIRLDRNDPGVGYRHVLTVPQLRKFIGLLPDWDEIALGLDAIVIDAGRDDAMGWYHDGVVSLSAWPSHSGFWFESD